MSSSAVSCTDWSPPGPITPMARSNRSAADWNRSISGGISAASWRSVVSAISTPMRLASIESCVIAA